MTQASSLSPYSTVSQSAESQASSPSGQTSVVFEPEVRRQGMLSRLKDLLHLPRSEGHQARARMRKAKQMAQEQAFNNALQPGLAAPTESFQRLHVTSPSQRLTPLGSTLTQDERNVLHERNLEMIDEKINEFKRKERNCVRDIQKLNNDIVKLGQNTESLTSVKMLSLGQQILLKRQMRDKFQTMQLNLQKIRGTQEQAHARLDLVDAANQITLMRSGVSERQQCNQIEAMQDTITEEQELNARIDEALRAVYDSDGTADANSQQEIHNILKEVLDEANRGAKAPPLMEATSQAEPMPQTPAQSNNPFGDLMQ